MNNPDEFHHYPERLRERLQVSSIDIQEHYSGIPILNNDFGKLASMLEVYYRGVHAASDPPSPASTAYTDLSSGQTPQEVRYSSVPFIDTILHNVVAAYRNRSCTEWSKWYDKEAPWVFCKSGVTVLFDRENDALILSLCAAYVGDRVEARLAKTLDVQRAVTQMVVCAHLPSMESQDLSVPFHQRSSTFRFDCQPLAQLVNSVVQRFGSSPRSFTAQDLIDVFLHERSSDPFDNGLNSFNVSLQGGLALNVCIKGGQRFVYFLENGKLSEHAVDTWQRDGSMLVLPFPTTYRSDEAALDFAFDPPQPLGHYSILFGVCRNSPDLPMHTPAHITQGGKVVSYIKTLLTR